MLLFADGSFPWKDHLLTLEPQLSVHPSVKFVLYPDSNAMWRVQCVPKDRHSFDNRSLDIILLSYYYYCSFNVRYFRTYAGQTFSS